MTGHIVSFKRYGGYWKYGISRAEAPGRYTLQDASHDGRFCGYHYYIYRFFFALWLRFDFYFSKIPLNYLQHLLILIPIICATTLIIYRVCHLYQSIWIYASISEAYHIIIAYLILAGALLAEHAISWLVGVEIPRSVAIMGYIISLLFCVTIRFGYRMSRYMAVKRKTERNAS